MIKKYIILVGVLVFSFQAYGASFDCGKAKTLVEHAICSDKQLSILDELLVTSYKKALADSPDPSTLKTAQREWLKSERDSCKDVDCLKQAYNLRLSVLNEPIAGTHKPSSGTPALSSQKIVIPAVKQTIPDEGISRQNDDGEEMNQSVKADGYLYQENENFTPGVYESIVNAKVYFDVDKDSFDKKLFIKKGIKINVYSAGYNGTEQPSINWLNLNSDCNGNILPWKDLGWIGVLSKDFKRVGDLPELIYKNGVYTNCR